MPATAALVARFTHLAATHSALDDLMSRYNYYALGHGTDNDNAALYVQGALRDMAALVEAFDSMNKEEYADNYRVANIHDSEQLAAYAEAQRNGCCGSVDMHVEGYLVGCNYGH